MDTGKDTDILNNENKVPSLVGRLPFIFNAIDFCYRSDIDPLELIWKVDLNVIPSLVRLAPNQVTWLNN